MKQFVIELTSMITYSVAIAGPEEREKLKKDCMENLRAIGEAIRAYRAEHHDEMPDWLSDLYPKYLQEPQILLCPADRIKGSPVQFSAYRDPKMPCSYMYEFNPMKVLSVYLFDMPHPENLTFKQAKTMQLKYFGVLVSAAICRHHVTHAINLSYGGKVYPSTMMWEYTPEAAKAVLSFLQNAIEQNPDRWEQEFSLDEIYKYFSKGDRVPELRVILEKQSNHSVNSLRILAEIYQFEGKIDKTIQTCHQLLRLVPIRW